MWAQVTPIYHCEEFSDKAVSKGMAGDCFHPLPYLRRVKSAGTLSNIQNPMGRPMIDRQSA